MGQVPIFIYQYPFSLYFPLFPFTSLISTYFRFPQSSVSFASASSSHPRQSPSSFRAKIAPRLRVHWTPQFSITITYTFSVDAILSVGSSPSSAFPLRGKVAASSARARTALRARTASRHPQFFSRFCFASVPFDFGVFFAHFVRWRLRWIEVERLLPLPFGSPSLH